MMLQRLRSQHLWVFCLPSDHPSFTDASSSHRFSFEAHYCAYRSSNTLKTSSNIKECGSRLVYERDLKEFSRLVYSDEAGPIGSSGSGSSDDEIEPGSDSSDDNHEPGTGSSDDDNEPRSDSSDSDDEPISKRFKKV